MVMPEGLGPERDVPGDVKSAIARVEAEEKRKRNWLGEKMIDGEFRAHTETTEDVPALDLVTRVYAMTWRGDRPLLVRPTDASTPWEIPLLDPSAADDAATTTAAKRGATDKALGKWLKAEMRERWGIRVKDWFQHARLELEAIPEATTVEPGTLRYYLFLCVNVASLDDLPDDAPWARRTIERREFGLVLRQQYQEFDEIVEAAHDAYLVRQAARSS